MRLKKYILEITVFVCGAVVMIFELVGSRIMGPYLGTSIFVWTSLIGVILGSLSLGYYLGGLIADKKSDYKILSLIILLSAVFIFLTAVIKDPLLIWLNVNFANIKINSIIASTLLFFPSSLFLGMISPYTVKLKIDSLATSGSTVGNLYAISTCGSIFGTFLSGFYLIPLFGTNKIIFSLVIVLAILSFLVYGKQFLKTRIMLLLSVSIYGALFGLISQAKEKSGFFDFDTAYNRVWIFDYINSDNHQVRAMKINNENSSAMFLDSDELVYEYSKYYSLAAYFNPGFKKALLIGGAGYSYPKEFLKKFPEAKMDVVEIDPGLTALAKKYFNLKDSPRLNIIHEDGRTYLNRVQEKYDVIYGDAFKSQYSLPYQLTTKEAIKKEYDTLNDNGVVIINLISAIEGGKSDFLKAEYATYKTIFPQVFIIPVNHPKDGQIIQNIILIALKSKNTPSLNSDNPEFKKYLNNIWTKKIGDEIPVLTDDYAPVDFYLNKGL